MGYPTKIATCCYCGTRAALVLDRGRHELSCSSCGAPLHDMKRFRKAPEPAPVPRGPEPAQTRPGPARYGRVEKETYRKPVKRRRKGLMRHLLEEALDVIEDIFD